MLNVADFTERLGFVIFLGCLSALAFYVPYRFLYTHKRAAQAALVPKRAFVTGNEREFFDRLCSALPEFYVFPQVAMSALLDVSVSRGHKDYWAERDRFSRKVCDFVVCRRNDMLPLLVVELDDKTHDFKKDAGRDDLLAQAGLRTLRFWSRNKPNRDEIRKRVAEVFGPAVQFNA